jgi:riboflavin kinase/FMN adenylyltransferase
VQVWRSLEEARGSGALGAGCVASIGVFDGVHRGHQQVLAVAGALAVDAGVPLVVLTFDPHPMAVVRPGTGPRMVASLRRRIALLERAGAAAVLVLPFTSQVAAMSPEQFVREVLVDGLHASVVVVGEDFRFGHRAAGDLHVLAALGLEHGFEAIGVGPVGSEGHRWSSTQVRDLVADGDVAGAALILGHPVAVEGRVVPGDRRGRDLGYPTANLALEPAALLPADGVYAATLHLLDEPEGTHLPAAVSVGTNPTFDGQERRVEAYVIDRDDLDLYGRSVCVHLVQRLRGHHRSHSDAALVEQMSRDVDAARRVLAQG